MGVRGELALFILPPRRARHRATVPGCEMQPSAGGLSADGQGRQQDGASGPVRESCGGECVPVGAAVSAGVGEG